MKKKWVVAVCAAIVISTLVAPAAFSHTKCCSSAKESAAVSKPQTECPVMKDQIKKEFFTDYQGKRIYFCCGGCVAEFKANPEKYMNVLRDSGVTLEDAPSEQN